MEGANDNLSLEELRRRLPEGVAGLGSDVIAAFGELLQRGRLPPAAAVGDAVADAVGGEVYDAVKLLGGNCFDPVYTGVGAICWLPSIRRWAQAVAGLLRAGGRLFIREGHPVPLANDK